MAAWTINFTELHKPEVLQFFYSLTVHSESLSRKVRGGRGMGEASALSSKDDGPA